MPQDSTHSWVKDAINVMSDEHDKHKPDHTMFFRVKEASDGGCPWRTSEEDHWVAHFASLLLDNARSFRHSIQFHQYFEKPSHGSEHKEKGGYDLSCGPYDNKTFRVRSMHKVVKGFWCDCGWESELEGNEATTDKEAKGDKRHLRSLLNQPDFATYLVVNVFYCLHDWRRMAETLKKEGHPFNNLRIPDFSSPLRTIIVDLAASRDRIPVGAKMVFGCRGLQKPVKSLEEWVGLTSAKGFMYATANGKPLEIITIKDLLAKMDEYWKSEKVWATSKVV